MNPVKGAAPNPSGKKYINWAYVKKYPVMSPKKGAAANAAAAKLQGMFYQGDDRIFDRNELDVRLLKYNYALVVERNAANYKDDKTKNARISFYAIQYQFIRIL